MDENYLKQLLWTLLLDAELENKNGIVRDRLYGNTDCIYSIQYYTGIKMNDDFQERYKKLTRQLDL